MAVREAEGNPPRLVERVIGIATRDRKGIGEDLIESLDAELEEGVDDAWRVELERRMAELDSRSMETIPWEELRARLYRR